MLSLNFWSPFVLITVQSLDDIQLDKHLQIHFRYYLFCFTLTLSNEVHLGTTISRKPTVNFKERL